MKRRLAWVLVALVLVGALVVMLRPTTPEVRQKAEMSFLYFTNSAGNPEVVFAVHFPKGYGGASWKHMEVDRWEGERWNPWKPDGLRPHGMRLHSGSLLGTVAANGRRIDLHASYLLPNTNDSWRIRTRVEEAPPLSFMERLPFIGRNSRPPWTYMTNPPGLFAYWITNEVGPATKAK